MMISILDNNAEVCQISDSDSDDVKIITECPREPPRKKTKIQEIIQNVDEQSRLNRNKKIADFITDLINKNEQVLKIGKKHETYQISDKTVEVLNTNINYTQRTSKTGISHSNQNALKLNFTNKIVRRPNNPEINRNKTEVIKSREILVNNTRNTGICLNKNVQEINLTNKYLRNTSNAGINCFEIKKEVLHPTEKQANPAYSEIGEIRIIKICDDKNTEQLNSRERQVETIFKKEMDVQCEMGIELYREMKFSSRNVYDKQVIFKEVGIQCEIGYEVLRAVL